ncbi:uncharacterized protein [Procambarus clarkii]|uniref:uncharacterized protein n=1 Tax=Procambarus clarkii TaxID=6728 RepID=UPI0037442BB9
MFTVSNGMIRIRMTHCILRLEVSLRVREWQHLCVVLTPALKVYLEGHVLTTSLHCTIDSNVTNATELAEVVVGGTLRNALPFSGFLADVVLYDEVLSDVEVKELAAGSQAPKESFVVGKSFIEDEHHQGVAVGVTFDTVDIKELVSNTKHASYIYCKEKTNFYDAKEFCRKLGMQQLEYTKEKGNELSKDLLEYIGNISVHIDNVWAQSSVRPQNEDTTCSLLRLRQDPLSVEYVDCQTIAYAFCEIPKNHSLKLLGFEDDNLFFARYDTRGVFESLTSYRLVYKNNTIYVENVQNRNILFERKVNSNRQLIGRHQWQRSQELDRNNKVITMTLTACQKNQFTCSNGDCIDLRLVCDFVNNCQDAADELFCNDTVSFPSFYSKKFSPAQGSSSKASVSLKVTLEQVKLVDLTNNLIELCLRLDLTWRDKRVLFKFLKMDVPVRLPENTLKDLWLPSVKMDTAVSDDKDKFDFSNDSKDVEATARSRGYDTVLYSYEARMFHGEETELRVSRAEMVVFLCNMDLFFYPFDIQVCRIPLRLRSHRVDDVRWNTSRVEAAVSNHFLLTLFDVVHLSVSVPDQHHDTAVVVVKLARKYGAYIFNTILPCIVLEIIGFLTHAFPTDDFSNRSTATLSCLIVKAAFFIQVCSRSRFYRCVCVLSPPTGVCVCVCVAFPLLQVCGLFPVPGARPSTFSTTLPPSAEPKLVDVWMFGNVSVLTLIFVVHVAVLCVHQQQQQYSLRHQPGEHQYLVDHHHHPGKHRQDLAHMDNPKAVGRLPSIAWHKKTSPNTTFLPRVINFVGFLLSFFSCGVLICAMYVTVTRARNAALLQ